MYEKATLADEPEVPMTPVANRSRVALEQDQRELEEAKENREALKSHTVPGYFDSEYGKAFLISQVTACAL